MNEQNGQVTTAAIALHEMFISLKEAGFTEQQALYLVGKQIEAASRPNGET